MIIKKKIKTGELLMHFFETVDVELEHLFEHPAVACNYNALRTCSKRRTPIF